MSDLKERILEAIRMARENGPDPQDVGRLKMQIASMTEGDEKNYYRELLDILIECSSEEQRYSEYSDI